MSEPTEEKKEEVEVEIDLPEPPPGPKAKPRVHDFSSSACLGREG